jgi:hypothetical protein
MNIACLYQDLWGKILEIRQSFTGDAGKRLELQDAIIAITTKYLCWDRPQQDLNRRMPV